MNPLIFFVIVIGIDIFLKSVKDKKKIEKQRQKKIRELNKKENDKPFKATESRVKRQVQENPSISKRNNNTFYGEHGSYREEHDEYRQRYEDRYKEIEKIHEDIRSGYTTKETNKGLYDPNAIKRSDKKEYDKTDVRNYGREDQKIDIPAPKPSTFKNDVLNGIIFSEILGKPKSMQKKDI